jgi:RHS repeat-associated protein
MMATVLTTYGAYGTHDATKGTARTAFAGQTREADTGWYLLGERPYSPTLRRFLNPDRLSPFASGGINRYAYCSGDPINRIDPGGNSWLGIFGQARAQAQRIVQLESKVTAAGGLDASVTTPGMLAASVAGTADTVSITAAIMPASMMAEPPKARGLFGRSGSEAASEGSALPPMRRRKSRTDLIDEDYNLKRKQPTRLTAAGVEVLMGSSIPRSRINPPRPGWSQVSTQWRAARHPTNSSSVVVAGDSLVHINDYDRLLSGLRNRNVASFTHYTGAHGGYFGHNWDIESLSNVGADRSMYEREKLYMEGASIRFGITVDVVDIGGWTSEQFREALSRDGVHTLAACFGMADSVVRREFKLPIQTMYYAPPLPWPTP